MLRLLFLGDIIGEPGRKAVIEMVPKLRQARGIDFVIVNGENAAAGRGITGRITIDLLRAGVAVITTGDHIWDTKEVNWYVQTADEQIFPGGTAFICDAGMCGPDESILGREIHPIIQRFMTSMPTSFPVAKGGVTLHGILVDIDPVSGKATSIRRVVEPYAPEPATVPADHRGHREEEPAGSRARGPGVD